MAREFELQADFGPRGDQPKAIEQLVAGSRAVWWWVAVVATAIALATRLALAIRFRQSIVGALLHPIGISLLVGIQWYSWFLRRVGRGIAWKDRAQADD